MEQPTYQESIQIGWTLLWRCLGGFLALVFAINLAILYVVPELTRAEPSLWISVIPAGVAAAISLFVIMPVIVRAMLSKSFHGFHLRFIRDNESSARVETTPAVSR